MKAQSRVRGQDGQGHTKGVGSPQPGRRAAAGREKGPSSGAVQRGQGMVATEAAENASCSPCPGRPGEPQLGHKGRADHNAAHTACGAFRGAVDGSAPRDTPAMSCSAMSQTLMPESSSSSAATTRLACTIGKLKGWLTKGKHRMCYHRQSFGAVRGYPTFCTIVTLCAATEGDASVVKSLNTYLRGIFPSISWTAIAIVHGVGHRSMTLHVPLWNDSAIRFGPREAGDGEMRQGATGRRQGGDRKTTGWRQEDDRKAAGKRQESDRRRQAGDRKATGELRQEGDRRATGRRQGGDRETTGKRQETRHSDRISDRKATGRRQEGNRASGDREATGKRQEKATGERQESDRRAAGFFLRQEGDRKATGRRQEGDRRATGLWRTTSETK